MSLQKNGFALITAADGHSAVDIFRARSGEIDIVLLDLTLPGLSGAEVFEEVRRIKPKMKIVLTSAYDREIVSRKFVKEAQFHFIRKPYRISDLVRTLQKVLSGNVADCAV